MAAPAKRLLCGIRVASLAAFGLLIFADAAPAAYPSFLRNTRSPRSADPVPEGAITRLGSLRFRHPASLTAAAQSVDGKLLASAGQDSMVRVWDAQTGKELQQLETPGCIPAAVALSPDGKILAASGYEMLRLWDMTTGKELPAFSNKRSSAYGLAFSPDGKLLAAAGGDDLVVRLWETATGKELHRLAGHKGWVAHVAFAPDGKLLATAGGDLPDRDGIIRLWNPATGKSAGQLKGHEHGITAIAFSADGKVLASTGRDDTLRLWDIATSKESRPAQRLGRGARSLVFALDGKTLVSGEDTTLRLWDLATLRERRRFDWRMVNDSDAAVAVHVFPDGRRLATAHQGGLLRVWDLATGREQAPREGHQGEVCALAVSPDGKWLASAEDSPVVRLWDRAAGKEVHQCVLPSGRAFSVAFSPDNRLLAAGSSTGLALCWDVATGEETYTFSSADRGIGDLRFAPDGKVLAAALADGTCLLWPVAGGTPRGLGSSRFGRMTPPLTAPFSLDFSPDGKLLAHGTFAEGTYLFHANTATDQPARAGRYAVQSLVDRRRDVPLNATSLVAFSPDGRALAVRAGDRVLLWEIGHGALPLAPPKEDEERKPRETELRRVLRRTLPQGNQVRSLAYSPDGRILAFGRNDGAVALWDLFTGKELRRFPAHPQRVNALTFFAQGRGLVSGGDDASLLVWDVDSLLRDRLPEPAKLEKTDLPPLWIDLARRESAPAFKAMCRLIQAPDLTISYFQEQISAPPPDPKHIKKMIADLDSNNFQVRQTATETLEKYGAHAERDLEAALATKPALEVTRRLEGLLRKVAAMRDNAQLRDQRLVEVLERIRTPTAQRLLQTLADGPVDNVRTEAARSALRRLAAK